MWRVISTYQLHEWTNGSKP